MSDYSSRVEFRNDTGAVETRDGPQGQQCNLSRNNNLNRERTGPLAWSLVLVVGLGRSSE